MSNQLDRLNAWMDRMTPDQVREALLETVSHCIDIGDVMFWSASVYPYWGADFEPIISDKDGAAL